MAEKIIGKKTNLLKQICERGKVVINNKGEFCSKSKVLGEGDHNIVCLLNLANCSSHVTQS